jgi:hypothetical protein
MVRVTALALTANPVAKFWIAGTMPERPVEFAAAAGAAEASWGGVAVAFAAATKTSARDMTSHQETR